MTDDAVKPLPASLEEIREDFLALTEPERLQLLLEFSRELPELPERYALAPGLLEKVEECQSPVRAFAEVDDDEVVHFYASAPAEAPTTRGFASILAQGLSGLSPQEVVDVPEDFPMQLGLTRAVSALRLNGMTGMLTRAKRQVVEQLAARA
ncbi:cysteine desulfuration protein SufE [Isoptericola jiangsuensis]|uniref:Cysteine desulfuration protein SufE n=1 Tax=Isoptericola jiangsuensis TaxID=548579 RepID=A0A2A9EW75_9MICO|nr:SufE family protein [Isoptericola jiangsuensis]PFG42409.1 cysteine desulfuration protein SufE [Isoptericola jiangsuensis]